MSRFFLIALFLILSLRVLFFALPSFPYDVGDWEAWSIRLVHVGPPNFYSKDYFADYFPGYLYILWITGLVFKFLSMPINSQIFEIFIKAITTLFDLGTAYFIYKITSIHNPKWKYFAAFFYLINPAVILNSSIWGQVDGVFTFFIVSSFYFLIEKKEIFKSGTLSSLGVLIKPQSVVAFPILLLYALKSFSRKNLYKGIGLGILVFFLLSLPFFIKDPVFGIFNLGIRSESIYQYNSLYAFNFWSIFGWWKPDNGVFIFSYHVWGIILFLISMVSIMTPLIRGQVNKKKYYLASSLSLFSSFLLLTRMHERYLFPFLAFILISALIYKSKFLMSAFILSSCLHFINLWFVYYYYIYVYERQFTNKDLFYNSYLFINSNYNLFSVLMIVLYLSILIFYFKYDVKKN